MNVLTTTWRQLVRRRLWPVALLLLAALAAVPVLLARDAAPVDTPPLPQTSAPAETAKAGADDAFAEPVVAKASTADRSRRRRVLGSRKNPFQPAPVKKPKVKADKASDEKADAPEKTGGSTAPTTPTTSAPTAPVTPVAPAPPKKTYAKGTLIVRFGDPTSDLDRMALPKLGALPKDDDETGPLLVYTRLTDHGKKAVFLVDASLEPTGDGTCEPHPSNCETVELSKGETEFFDVIDPETGEVAAQYELDLVAIK
ncbi:MAG TPA: hypothetical protein VFM58_03600 [Solirubrobacteraceae bacterium]|jgi:hypothetical protein|nr:hypothetical protein [Solirubrobacteraceae bacterium]